MTFAERALEILNQKGISKNELARKANLSSSGISTALRVGGNPRESTMIAIYNALKITPDEFWTDRRNKTASPEEDELLSIFYQMNVDGRKAVINLAKTLLDDPRNRQESSISSAV